MNLDFIKLRNIKKYTLICTLLLANNIWSIRLNSYAQLDDSKGGIKSSIAYSDATSIADVVINEHIKVENSEYWTYLTDLSDGGVLLKYDDSYEYRSFLVKYNKYNELEWKKEDEPIYSIRSPKAVELKDGSLIVAGSTSSTSLGFDNKGATDAVIVKYTSSGEQEWIKSFGGAKYDSFNSVVIDSNGELVVIGESNSTDAGFENKGGYDSFIIKYDKDGNQKWINFLSGDKNDYFTDIKNVSDGGFIVCGYTESSNLDFTGKGYNDIVVAKYTYDGQLQWINNYGGSKYDKGYSIVETSDRGFSVVGASNSIDAGFDGTGSNNAIVIKCDRDGNQQWIKRFNDLSSLNVVESTQDGGVITAYHSNKYIVKYDKDGNQQWVRYIDTIDYIYSIKEVSHGEYVIYGDYIDSHKKLFSKFIYKEEYDNYIDLSSYINSILGDAKNNYLASTKTSDGGFVAVGNSDSENIEDGGKGEDDCLIVKYDRNSNPEWIKIFGGSGKEYFNSVTEMLDGSIIVVGTSYSSDAGFSPDETNTWDNDAIIVKYDKYGNQLWVKSLSGSLYDNFSGVEATSDGGFVAVGYSSSANIGINNKGDNDMIIAKYDSDGNQSWIKSIGGSNYDWAELVIEASNGDLVVIGGGNSTDAEYTNNGLDEAVIIRYGSDGSFKWIKSFGGSNDEWFSSVVELPDGSILAVANSCSTDAGFVNKGHFDAVLIKYDSDGNQEWIKNFGGSAGDGFFSMIKASDGGIIAVGDSQSIDAGFISKNAVFDCYDAIIVKFDNDANMEWINSFGGSYNDTLTSVIETSNGEAIAFGSTYLNNTLMKTNNYSDAIILKYDLNGTEKFIKYLNTSKSITIDELSSLRDEVNAVLCNKLKEYLNTKLNILNSDFGGLDLKNSSANLDVYIKSENMLLLSLSTNQITFEDFSGVSDMLKDDAVEISINSSLPYNLNAYLMTEIQNSDKTNTMEKEILQLKEDSEIDYQYFENVDEKMTLKSSCEAGNDKTHLIDFKLKGGIAHEKDIYKTTIKFEAEQI